MKKPLQFSLLGDFYNQYAYSLDSASAVSDGKVEVQSTVMRVDSRRQHRGCNLEVRYLATVQDATVARLCDLFRNFSKDLADGKTQVCFGWHSVDAG
jgi:hypothetical protein